MNTGGRRELTGTRTRQYISFAILALFLGLFVSAMTAPPSAHMVLSFSGDVQFSQSVDQRNHIFRLSFPGVTAKALKQKHLRPYVMGDRRVVKDVRISEHPEKGAELQLRLSANANVRLLRFTNPHQLMINVVDAPQAYNYQLVAERDTVYRKS